MHILRFKPLAVAAASLLLAGASYAHPITYSALLSGPAEAPPNASPGTGKTIVIYDDVAHTLHVQAWFADLIGLTTVAHIHAATALPGEGTAGVATQVPTFAGFPAGVTSGSYDNIFDLTMAASFNPAYVTNNGGTLASAEAALALALAEGKAYLNIHTTEFGGGEIRGFLTRVPDTTATAPLLVLAGIAMLGVARRQRNRAA